MVKKAKEQIAKVLKVNEKEIYFTSGGTESDNLAIIGCAMANKRAGMHLITTKIEHPAVLETMKYLEQQGFEVTYLPVNEYGQIRLEDLKAAMRRDTILVSIMHTNNEIGALQPIAEAGALIKAMNPRCLFHVDAVQGFGKCRIWPKKMMVDLLSVSAHKIHGPRGVGFLYVKDGVRISPLLSGGGQEKSLRSGTENLPGIAGFAKIAKRACAELSANEVHVKKLNNIFREILTEEIRACNIISNDECCPYVLNVAFPGLRAEVIQHSVEQKGVYISVGSACSSHKKDRSPTLTAMGYSNNVIDGAIRISFTYQNTPEQAEFAAKVICAEVKKLYGRRKGRR